MGYMPSQIVCKAYFVWIKLVFYLLTLNTLKPDRCAFLTIITPLANQSCFYMGQILDGA